ncbi:MAG TPA: helix-turn-helix domain-containing protein [Chloroflexia bacterium]|nr:helix-turn-helix domain-containing protein [Chloroflexia bacterium]
MPDSATKRTYHSPRRREQAEATRRNILATAFRLFAAQGYAATTVATIAREAGVSVPTITAVFGTKLELLAALIRSAVRGDDAGPPLALRPWWEEMLQEADPARQLVRYAATARQIRERTQDLAAIVLSAATADPEIADLRRQLNEARLADMRSVAEALARKGALRPGLTAARAADQLWALDSVETYAALVRDRGWSPAEFESWLAAILIATLLDPAVPAAP